MAPSPALVVPHLDNDCFWCGRPIVGPHFHRFSIAENLAPEALIHTDCLNGKKPAEIALAYHRWVGDIANAPRESFVPFLRASTLDLIRRPTRAA